MFHFKRRHRTTTVTLSSTALAPFAGDLICIVGSDGRESICRVVLVRGDTGLMTVRSVSWYTRLWYRMKRLWRRMTGEMR